MVISLFFLGYFLPLLYTHSHTDTHTHTLLLTHSLTLGAIFPFWFLCSLGFQQLLYLCSADYTDDNVITLLKHMRAKLLQACPTLSDSMDCSSSGSSVHRILRQEYWSGLPCPPLGIFWTQGSAPSLLLSPGLAGGFFTASATGEALRSIA